MRKFNENRAATIAFASAGDIGDRLFLGGCGTQKTQMQERDYSDAWCETRDGDSRAVLPDGTKPDCLLENAAVSLILVARKKRTSAPDKRCITPA